MSKMTTRVPLNAVVVQREGKNVKAKSGVPFDFTEGEIKEMEARDKATGRQTLREPVNESAAVDPKVQKKLVDLMAKATDAKDDAARTKAKEAVPEGFGEEAAL